MLEHETAVSKAWTAAVRFTVFPSAVGVYYFWLCRRSDRWPSRRLSVVSVRYRTVRRAKWSRRKNRDGFEGSHSTLHGQRVRSTSGFRSRYTRPRGTCCVVSKPKIRRVRRLYFVFLRFRDYENPMTKITILFIWNWYCFSSKTQKQKSFYIVVPR